jgi:beta-glucosidase
VLQAFQAESDWDVEYRCGVDFDGGECSDRRRQLQEGILDAGQDLLQNVEGWIGLSGAGADDEPNSIGRAVTAAKEADYVVVCIGEAPYAEKPGDIRSLRLSDGQYELVRAIRSTCDARIIVVYFGGRPRLLGDIVGSSDAILIAFLPGTLGGTALVDIVAGRVNPSGRLPLTYPLYDDEGGIPYFHSISDRCRDDLCDVQWNFGYGLSYTTFEYKDLAAYFDIEGNIHVSVTVTNQGSIGGNELVLFFSFDDSRPTTPEYKRLRAFGTYFLAPMSSITVDKVISSDDLKFVGPHDDRHYILAPGMQTTIGVGASTDCRQTPSSSLCTSPLANSLSFDTYYVAACHAACDIWQSTGCFSFFGTNEESCLNMCQAISKYPTSSMDYQNNGWDWNYVQCIESVAWGMRQSVDHDSCSKMTSLCRDIFNTASMDRFGHGDLASLSSLTLQPSRGAVAVALSAGLAMSLLMMYLVLRIPQRWRQAGVENNLEFIRVQNAID